MLQCYGIGRRYDLESFDAQLPLSSFNFEKANSPRVVEVRSCAVPMIG